MADLALKCGCGKVKGVATNISAGGSNRAVCYCKDCQAFAHYLGNVNEIMDQHGGTPILQLPCSAVNITEGAQHIGCMRLTPKGTYRWYADCCKTPIGNTLSPSWPFIGIIEAFIDGGAAHVDMLGTEPGRVYVKNATGTIPDDLKDSGVLFLIGTLTKIIGWKLRGLAKPSPFFASNGRPISPAHILESKPKHDVAG